MDADAVDSTHGIDLHAPTADSSHPSEESCFVERFPMGLAGAPIPEARQSTPNGLDTENIWSPFQTRRDWEFAQWAKNRGPSSTAVTELLAIEGVRLY